jgi:hypothetical protein
MFSKLDPKKIENTIFGDISEKEFSKINKNLDIQTIDKLFGRPKSKKKLPKPSSTSKTPQDPNNPNQKPKKKKIVKKTFLDDKRAKEINIALGRLRKPNYIIKQSIISCVKNGDFLTESILNTLIKICPTKAEMNDRGIKKTKTKKLHPQDRWIKEISTIPMVKERLEALYFKKTGKDQIDEIQDNIERITKVFKSILTNTLLPQIYQLTLTAGNYLNGTSHRGGAFGFSFKSLSKLYNKTSNLKDKSFLYFILSDLFKQGKVRINVNENFEDWELA